MNRSLKLLIAGSILLNLLLAGMVAGQMGRAAMSAHGAMEEFISTLPEEHRAPLRNIVDKMRADTANLERQIVDARNAVAHSVETEPFNKADYEEKMQRLRDLRQRQLGDRRVMALEEISQQCTPAERASLAEILRHTKPSLWPEPGISQHAN